MWHLINRLVDTPSLCLYCIFSCFKVYECWHGDYFVYILHVPYYTLNLVIMCVRIYLLMFVSIYFIRLCVAWLPFFFLYDACLVVMFICDTDMLTILIDSLACFSIWLFLLYDYLAFFDMYILIFVYLIHLGMIDSICCILFCLSQHIVHYAIYQFCLSYLYLAYV